MRWPVEVACFDVKVDALVNLRMREGGGGMTSPDGVSVDIRCG